MNINTILLEQLDQDNTLFSFTRKDNLYNISQIGLTTEVGKRENETTGDKNMPAIYFSQGFSGLLKTIDVFIRWEYDQMAKAYGFPTGGYIIYDELMQEVYKKVYNDFKDRIYLKLDLKEGKDPLISDYNSLEYDFKKIKALKEGYINDPSMLWQWGSYSNLNSMNMETWNMYTHIGRKVIDPRKLCLIKTEEGKQDALSIIMKVRQLKDYDFELTDLDNFLQYVNEQEYKGKFSR